MADVNEHLNVLWVSIVFIVSNCIRVNVDKREAPKYETNFSAFGPEQLTVQTFWSTFDARLLQVLCFRRAH